MGGVVRAVGNTSAAVLHDLGGGRGGESWGSQLRGAKSPWSGVGGLPLLNSADDEDLPSRHSSSIHRDNAGKGWFGMMIGITVFAVSCCINT
jgi:hypothetical protein